MKITKQNLIKILSVVVAVALLAVNTVVSFATNGADNGGDTTEPEVYCLPTEQLGYYMGDTATAYPGADVDIRTSGRLTGEALEAAAPRLSEKGEGYNGGYAMEVGTTDAYSRYLFKYRLEGAMSKLKAVPITIEMKVKMVSGSVKNIYAAHYRSSAPSGYASPDTYTANDLSATEWTTLTFTRTETAGTSRWMFINIVSESEGAVLLIDEIRVYLASAPETNYLIGEYIWLNKNATVPYTSLPTNVGDFDVAFTKTPTIDFDNSVDPSVEYAPGSVKAYSNANSPTISSTVQPEISALGDGVKGSYAMQLSSTVSGSERLYLQPSNLSAEGMSLRQSTTYTVKFKVRVKSGTVKTFESGIFENGGRGFISAFKIYSVELSDKWQCYSFDVTTTNVSGQWRRLAFHYNTGESGAIVQLDDIEVYKKNADNSLTPIDFNHSSQYNQGIIGSYDIERKASLPFDNTPYDDTSNLIAPEKFGVRTATVAPVISEKGDGVKGTYAMNIPVNANKVNVITMQGSSRQNKNTSLYWDTTYTVDFKIRVKSGGVSEFSVGIADNPITTDSKIEGFDGGTFITDESNNNYGKWYYPSDETYFYTLSGEDITTEWKRFSCKVTTNKNNKNWKKLALSLIGTSTDTVVQIDDLQVYWMDGEERTDIVYQSHAATGYIDVSGSFDEWRVAYTTDTVDNTPGDFTYYPVYFEDWTDSKDADGNYLTRMTDTAPTIFNDGLADKIAQDTYRNSIIPRLEQYSGVKGSYAFVIGDTSVPNISAYEVGMRFGRTNQLKDNTEYTFIVRLKKEGTVDRFKIGVRESYSDGTIHYPFQLLDSEISNEWVEYTFKYTTDSNCTGNWSEIFFAYSSVSGAKVYIDDVHMYISADAEKNQCFTWADFDYTDLGQAEKVVLSTDFPQNFEVPYFAPSTNSDKTVVKADPENGVEGFDGTGNVAYIKNYNGNGVLAIGFNQYNSNVEFRQNLSASKPGGTYKISFKILVQGDVERCRVGVYNSWGRYEYYNAGADFNQYEHGKWTTVSYTWTDPANYISATGYRYFVLEFIGAAGTGVLLDDLSVTYVSDDWGGEAPNIIDYGSFGSYKTEKPALVWSDEYTYKEEK